MSLYPPDAPPARGACLYRRCDNRAVTWRWLVDRWQAVCSFHAPSGFQDEPIDIVTRLTAEAPLAEPDFPDAIDSVAVDPQLLLDAADEIEWLRDRASALRAEIEGYKRHLRATNAGPQ